MVRRDELGVQFGCIRFDKPIRDPKKGLCQVWRSEAGSGQTGKGGSSPWIVVPRRHTLTLCLEEMSWLARTSSGPPGASAGGWDLGVR